MTRRIPFLILGLLLLAGCGGESSSSIFTDAKQVVIASPQPCKKFLLQLGDADDVFQFGGQEGSLGLSEQRVFAAIFDDYPQVQKGQIVNPGDAQWVWHSGLRSTATAAAGKVRFTDGTGTTGTEGAPASLESCKIRNDCSTLVGKVDRNNSKTYYFAVWAWNEEREISYFSDQVTPFCFTLDPDQRGQDCPSTCSSY